MRKKFLIGVLSIVMLSGFTGCALSMVILTGCTDGNCNDHKTIVANGKSISTEDNININLKKGYWIKGYAIDYDKGQIIINLEKENNNNEEDN